MTDVTKEKNLKANADRLKNVVAPNINLMPEFGAYNQ